MASKDQLLKAASALIREEQAELIKSASGMYDAGSAINAAGQTVGEMPYVAGRALNAGGGAIGQGLYDGYTNLSDGLANFGRGVIGAPSIDQEQDSAARELSALASKNRLGGRFSNYLSGDAALEPYKKDVFKAAPRLQTEAAQMLAAHDKRFNLKPVLGRNGELGLGALGLGMGGGGVLGYGLGSLFDSDETGTPEQREAIRSKNRTRKILAALLGGGLGTWAMHQYGGKLNDTITGHTAKHLRGGVTQGSIEKALTENHAKQLLAYDNAKKELAANSGPVGTPAVDAAAKAVGANAGAPKPALPTPGIDAAVKDLGLKP